MKRWIALAICLGIGAVWLFFHLSAPKVRNADSVGGTIICLGDSLTAGVGAGMGEDYPSQLSRLIGLPVVNAGRAGDTTADALSRLEPVLAARPRIVIIILGGNDIRKGVNREEAFANLAKIVAQVQEGGAMVVLGGIDIPLFSRGFEEGYPKLARESGSVLVPNVFDGIWGRDGMMSDQIHPTGAGYTVMANHIHAAIKPYLSARKQG